MAKEKFHTSHHHERRYHKHGIKKPTKTRYVSLSGCNQKFLRNRRRAIKFDPKQNKLHFKAKPKFVKKVAPAPAPKKEGKKEVKKEVAKKEVAKKEVKKDIKKEAKKEAKKQ